MDGKCIRTMKLLTRRAMAVLGIQRLLPAQLILDLAAVTACFIASMEVWVVVVNRVGRSMLPFIVLALGVSIIAVIAIGTVCRCLFSHDSRCGVKLRYVDTGENSGCWSDGA